MFHRTTRNKLLLLLPFLYMLSGPAAVNAKQVQATRPWEPVVIDAGSLLALEDDTAPIYEFGLFRYEAATNTWTPVPFQIDQQDTEGSFFGSFDNLIDANDQLVFMLKDAGDYANPRVWPTETNLREHARVEIKIQDPLNSSYSGYFYLFRSTNGAGLEPLQGYMEYRPYSNEFTSIADSVMGASYLQGHNDVHGLPDFLQITGEKGSQGLNVIDRFKLRIQASITIFIPIPVVITEENFPAISDSIKIKAGPIRILRETQHELMMSDLPVDTAAILVKFYPNSMILSANLALPDLGATSKVNALRLSLDLNRNINDFSFSNQNNIGPIKLDGAATLPDKTILERPQMNWDQVQGSKGTVVKLTNLDLSSVNNANAEYYFHDAAQGTADGSKDTGDGISNGDIGMSLVSNGSSISGLLPISMETFYLGSDQPQNIGETLRDQKITTVKKIYTEQIFDDLAPGAITDLTISDITEQTITLTWTAPGDDGIANGPATSYQLYYAKETPGDNIGLWIQNQAQPANNLPAPGAPGENQQFAITFTQSKIEYYFVLVAIDEVGNQSAYSNIVSGITVSVELAAFEANVVNDKVEISWRTAAEADNSGFAIERRRHGATGNDWEERAFIEGKGSSDQGGTYSFTETIENPGRYQYRLRQMDVDGSFEISPEISVEITAPTTLHLDQNYPNPFIAGKGTSFRYQLPARADNIISLKIYNMLGQEIATIFKGPAAAGFYTMTWNGKSSTGGRLPSGLYFAVLEAQNLRAIKKVTLIY